MAQHKVNRGEIPLRGKGDHAGVLCVAIAMRVEEDRIRAQRQVQWVGGRNTVVGYVCAWGAIDRIIDGGAHLARWQRNLRLAVDTLIIGQQVEVWRDGLGQP